MRTHICDDLFQPHILPPKRLLLFLNWDLNSINLNCEWLIMMPGRSLCFIESKKKNVIFGEALKAIPFDRFEKNYFSFTAWNIHIVMRKKENKRNWVNKNDECQTSLYVLKEFDKFFCLLISCRKDNTFYLHRI